MNFSFRDLEEENLASHILTEGVSPQIKSVNQFNYEFLGSSPGNSKQESNNPFKKTRSAKNRKANRKIARLGSKSESSQERNHRVANMGPLLNSTGEENLSPCMLNTVQKGDCKITASKASKFIKDSEQYESSISLKEEISSLLKIVIMERKSSKNNSELLVKNENSEEFDQNE